MIVLEQVKVCPNYVHIDIYLNFFEGLGQLRTSPVQLTAP